MEEIRVASVGDVCIDIYPQYEETFPGGTALNVAMQVINEGGSAGIFSAIASDEYGKRIKDVCIETGIDVSHLIEKKGTTSSIEITLDSQKHPTFSNWNIGVLQEYLLAPEALDTLKNYDVARIVSFKPMKLLFDQFCSLDLPNTVKVADFAGTSSYSEELVFIQSYIQHLGIIIKSPEDNTQDTLKLFQTLSQNYPDKIFLVLQGKDGSSAFEHGERFDQESLATEVQDTNGAGDAFVGSFITNYLRTKDVQFALFRGTLSASKNITHRGAVTSKASSTI